MRKLAALLLACLCLLCACAHAPAAVPAAANTGLRTRIEAHGSPPLSFAVNGTSVTLPITVRAVQTLGFAAELPAREVAPFQLSEPILFDGGGCSFTGYLYNTEGEPRAPHAGMPLVWVRLEAAAQTQPVTLPQGLSLVGLTTEQVMAAYGEPQEKALRAGPLTCATARVRMRPCMF